jgi:hypothetical protein
MPDIDAADTDAADTDAADIESVDVAEQAEVVEAATDGDEATPAVSQPAKVMRVGTMIKELLNEVRNSSLDEASRERLRDIYDQSVRELSESLSDDLREELERLALPFDEDTPSEAELRVAKAQLVGWLEGLFHGIQATLFAQQMAARQQLEGMRGSLPPGAVPPGGPSMAGGPGGPATNAEDRPGTYL